MTARPEALLRLALLGVYALLSCFLLREWELKSDDGRTLAAAWRAFTEPFFWGPRSSVGAWHLPFVYYYQGLFLKVSGSILGVQAGILLSQLAAHWLLIGVGRRLFSWKVGYLASLFAFTNPAFLLLGLRFWEPVLLPFFTMLALDRLLAFLPGRKWSHLLIALFSLACAVSAHLNAILLLPVFALVLAGTMPKEEWTLSKAAALAGAAALCLLPFVEWGLTRGKFFELAALIILTGAFFYLALARFPMRLKLGLSALTGAVLLFSLLLVYGGLRPMANPVREYLTVLDFFGAHAFQYTRRVSLAPSWNLLLAGLPVLLFFFVVLNQRKKLSAERLVFFLWITVPFVFLLLGAFFFSLFYQHWLAFLFPAAWIAVAAALTGVLSLVKPPMTRSALECLVLFSLLALQGIHSVELVKHMKSSGGIGQRMADLGTKLDVMNRIFQASAKPVIVVVANPYLFWWDFDFDAWRFLAGWHAREKNSLGPQAERHFYIYQPEGIQPQAQLLDAFAEVPEVKKEQVGPVTLFSSEGLVSGAGAKAWPTVGNFIPSE